MNNRSLIFISAKFCTVLALLAASTLSEAADTPPLSAAQVVARNATARGGVAAWHAIHSISFSGKLDAGRTHTAPAGTVDSYTAATSNLRPGQLRMMLDEMPPKQEEVIKLPFRLDMKRPRMSRLELDFAGHTAIQVYDGGAGWKLRPFMGRSLVEPFSPAELKIASSQQDLDGLLIDAAAKGSRVSTEGMDKVNGVRAYKLKVALRNGETRRVWVDASTFLEIKIDGFRDVGGRLLGMTTLLSDYRPVDKVMIPFVMETRGAGMKESERIVLDKVAINADLPDARFAKP